MTKYYNVAIALSRSISSSFHRTRCGHISVRSSIPFWMPAQYNHSGADPKESFTEKISWYPGHIAKAERELTAYLKKVDVVIELRDARIPLSTAHPSVPRWVGQRPLIVVISRIDQITPQALNDWRRFFESNPAYPQRPDIPVFFVNSKTGIGISKLRNKAMTYNEVVNNKRFRLGIQPRPVRAAVIGYPNVGKSALINKLLNKTVARSKDTPGVTRSLQWVKLGEAKEKKREMDLLDSPGIIPAMHISQKVAMRLAMCNDIGGASYDDVAVASALCNEINEVYKAKPSYFKTMKDIRKRYHMKFNELEGFDLIQTLAVEKYNDCEKTTAAKILADFRNGKMGKISLEHYNMTKIYEQPIRTNNTEKICLRLKTEADIPKRSDDGGDSGRQPTSFGAVEEDFEDENELFEILKGSKSAIMDKGEYDGW